MNCRYFNYFHCIAIIFATIVLTNQKIYGQEPNKPIGELLADLDRSNDTQVRDQAKKTIRQMGTNAVPLLLNELSNLEKIDQTNYTTYATQGRFFRIRDAFDALGTNAAMADSALVVLMNRGKLSFNAAWILAETGPEGMEYLVHALTNSPLKVRISIASVLNNSNATVAVPSLIQCLNYQNVADNTESVTMLRDCAATALGLIHSSADIAVPALIEKLKDDNFAVRMSAARALGRFGKQAQTAIPALHEMSLNDPNVTLRIIAEGAIKIIEAQ